MGCHIRFVFIFPPLLGFQQYLLQLALPDRHIYSTTLYINIEEKKYKI